MIIIKNIKELETKIKNMKNISFVPTMGALHWGHISLIKRAKKKSKNVIVSIFINKKQFNSSKDFKSYPRNLNKDLNKLKQLKVKIAFLPIDKEINSFKRKNKIFLDKFSKKLCGKFRPGHFYAVINIVNTFLEIIKPTFLMMGEKDFQQVYLIKKHIIKNNINVKLIKCKTVRNKQGLAMSSRNKNLNIKNLKTACKVINFLKVQKRIMMSQNNLKKKINLLKKKILSLGAQKVDYLEIINLNNIDKNYKKNNLRLFVSFYINKIRLIDNF